MPLTPTQQPPYYQNENGISVKVYKALMTQSSTNAPTATIIENTLGPIVWTRLGAGHYRGTLTGAFPLLKTTLQITKNWVGFGWLSNDETNNTLTIATSDNQSSPVPQDQYLYYTYINITVYP